MAKYVTAKEDIVPFGQKLAFGSGHLANQLFPAALGVFMVVLVLALKMDPFLAGVLAAVPRLLDALTDPIMGYISDNTRSKWGRRNPYIFIGSLITGFTFMIMWQLNPENSQTYNFFYFLTLSIVFYIGYTIFATPLIGLGYEMTPDYNERTRLMAVSQWLGQVAWMIAPWFWVIIYNESIYDTPAQGARNLAIWVGALCMILGMMPAFFNKELVLPALKKETKINMQNLAYNTKQFIAGITQTLKCRPFLRLCGATFLVFNGFQTIAQFAFYIIIFYLFNGDTNAAGNWPAWFGTVSALATAFLVIPVITAISARLGKRNAFIIATIISMVGYGLKWWGFSPVNPYLMFMPIPLLSFGIGGLFTLMMSMTADVCDLDELNTGERREGTFGAVYWWMVKFGFAIAGLLSGAILSIVGFDATAESQSESAITGLRLFYSGLPILGTMVAIFVMRDYGLTEDRANDIRKELDNRKKKKKTSTYTDGNIFSNGELDGLTLSQLKAKFPQYISCPLDFSKLSTDELKDYFTPVFRKSMHGICFSAFEADQNPGDLISEHQIIRRLNILRPHTKWIRSFSCTGGLEKLPAIARQMGFKTFVGAWISNNSAQNQLEIQNLKKLLKQGVVDMASVGNEVLFRGELSEERMIDYLKDVKEAAGDIPLGYVDVYYEVQNRPAIRDLCDVIMINCYPYWEGAAISHAGLYLQEMYHNVKRLVPDKKVIIAETGWPSEGGVIKSAIPSPKNVMRYFMDIDHWQRQAGVEVFYFSSFDESWKVHLEGWAGSSWGLWNEKEEFKYESRSKRVRSLE